MSVKVCVDNIIQSWHGGGGIEVYFSELISRGVRYGIDFQVESFGQYDAPNFLMRPSSGRYFERYRDFSRNIDGDIFHSSYYRLPLNKSVKIVTTVHDFTYERIIGGGRALMHSWLKNKSIRASDAIVCISENTRMDLLNYVDGLDSSRIHVVYNGVSDAYLSRLSSPGNAIGSKDVLFVGGRASYKNFDISVKAVSLIKGFNLVIVGGGGINRDEMDLLNFYLPNRWRHEGYVSNEALADIYSHAFCLLYLSSYEGFGIPVLEAMACSCPVVAVKTSSIPEVGGGAVNYVSAPDVDEVVSAIEMLNGNQYREGIISLGNSQAALFSWEKFASEMALIYKSL